MFSWAISKVGSSKILLHQNKELGNVKNYKFKVEFIKSFRFGVEFCDFYINNKTQEVGNLSTLESMYTRHKNNVFLVYYVGIIF